MVCEHAITVTSTTTIANQPPVQFELPIKVSALCNICITVHHGKELVVPILPEMVGSPDFVLINPQLPDAKKYTWKNQLEYHTSKSCGSAKRKPLGAPHLFYCGMPEWMTDSLQNEALKELVFWNNIEGREPDAEEKENGLKAFEDQCLKVHIVVGYHTADPNKLSVKGDHGSQPTSDQPTPDQPNQDASS